MAYLLLTIGGALGLAVTLVGLGRDGTEALGNGPQVRSALIQLGTRLEGGVSRRARARKRDQDLAVIGRSAESLALQVGAAALGGAVVPLVIVAAAGVFGLALPPAVGLVGAFVGLGTGVMAPLLNLRQEAEKKRASFRQALSAWLQLVVLAQAGGMGVESALESASRVSADPPFLTLRRALARARHAGTTPWDSLSRLGGEIGVDELSELSASLGLAGTEGARVRASLAAKSTAMRRRQISEAHAAANATTERLFLPSIVLMVGFLIFLMYPAGVSLTRVL